MTETAADEQDLAKALDSVASAASSLDGSTPSLVTSDDTKSDDATDSAAVVAPSLSPILPPDAPVAPPTPVAGREFPEIKQVHDSNDNLYPRPPAPVLDAAPALAPLDAPVAPVAPVETGPLADIKKDALSELRPLVDKLNVSPEEKFDTYLLLIRSTDDSALIGPAHEAAKSISDETRRAEALLDIIKEIDYLSHQNKAA